MSSRKAKVGLGYRTPALLLLLWGSVLAVPPIGGAALAQSRQPAAQSLPVPDQLTLSKLLWSTIAAVDHANKTGNYSVLRDLGSTGFQTINNAAALAGIFAGIRNQRIDLSDTLLVPPTYEFAPVMVEPRLLRMRGAFNLRPRAIAFDLIYQWNDGWKLHGIALEPMLLTSGSQPPSRK